MTAEISYGPGAPTESELRLLGPVAGKRVLVLGCTAAQVPFALAQQDAKVVALDPDLDRLDEARRLADDHDVRVELHHVEPADLAFVRADTIDAAISVLAMSGVDDLDRVFRQVHRVLRSQGPLVVSLPHPATGTTEGRSWFERSVSDVFTSLVRTSFAVDVLLEPLPAPGARLPTMLILRGRKLS
jgi:SAM-dependent methyltransferase